MKSQRVGEKKTPAPGSSTQGNLRLQDIHLPSTFEVSPARVQQPRAHSNAHNHIGEGDGGSTKANRGRMLNNTLFHPTAMPAQQLTQQYEGAINRYKHSEGGSAKLTAGLNQSASNHQNTGSSPISARSNRQNQQPAQSNPPKKGGRYILADS